jgi:hypothetical protein
MTTLLSRIAARKPVEAVVEPINYQSDDDIHPNCERKTPNRGYSRFCKSKSKKKIEVPLSECLGIVNYTGPRKTFIVAIVEAEPNKRPKCLFVNEDTLTAYHEFGGFPGNPNSMSEYTGDLNSLFN